jgi:hypothetical protein
MDLFIVDMHSDMSQEPGPEREKSKSEIDWPSSRKQAVSDLENQTLHITEPK